MSGYRTILTVTDPRQIVVNDVPFDVGQQVEVILVPAGVDRARNVQQWRQLLKETQALPQVQSITDEEIEAEVAAYRSGR